MLASTSSSFKVGEAYPVFLYPESAISNTKLARCGFSVPLENSKLAIQKLDLTNLIEKLSKPSRLAGAVWEKKALLRAVEVYKNWLWIIKKYSAEYFPLPPSIGIDEIWHYHIFDTKRYIWDCESIFGHFLHHNPYVEEGINLKEGFKTTSSLYKAEFGEELPSFLIES